MLGWPPISKISGSAHCHCKNRFLAILVMEKLTDLLLCIVLSMLILHGSLCLTLLCGVRRLLLIQLMKN